MSCPSRLGDAEGYGQFWCLISPGETLDPTEQSIIETSLDLATSDISAALYAAAACDCTLASWATVYLTKLTYYDAAALYNCPCGQALNDDKRKQQLLTWVSEQLALIRSGEIEVCAGATGSKFPAVGHAEHNLNVWQGALIIYNKAQRNS